jgi:hypothetical protein
MFVTKFVESTGCSTLHQLTRDSGVLVLLQTVGKKKVLEVEKGSTRSHSLEYSLWKGLCTCRKKRLQHADGDYNRNGENCAPKISVFPVALFRCY